MTSTTKQFDFSNRVYLVALLLVVVSAIFAVSSVLSLPHLQPRELTVSADGKVLAIPDIALFQFGVVNEGENIAAITQANAEKVNKILSDIKVLEVDEKDLKTTVYNLAPRYEYTNKGERVFKGYAINQQVQVKIRDFSKISSVYNVITNGGATMVDDLTFTFDDIENVKKQAREKAIAEAKDKAKSMARMSGLRLGKVLNVQESYYPYYGGGVMMEKSSMPMSDEMPNIEAGQQEITVSVAITYRVQ